MVALLLRDWDLRPKYLCTFPKYLWLAIKTKCAALLLRIWNLKSEIVQHFSWESEIWKAKLVQHFSLFLNQSLSAKSGSKSNAKLQQFIISTQITEMMYLQPLTKHSTSLITNGASTTSALNQGRWKHETVLICCKIGLPFQKWKTLRSPEWRELRAVKAEPMYYSIWTLWYPYGPLLTCLKWGWSASRWYKEYPLVLPAWVTESAWLGSNVTYWKVDSA